MQYTSFNQDSFICLRQTNIHLFSLWILSYQAAVFINEQYQILTYYTWSGDQPFVSIIIQSQLSSYSSIYDITMLLKVFIGQ